jgi:hypothetical protein
MSLPVGAIDPRPLHEAVSFKEARAREWSAEYRASFTRYCELLGGFHAEMAKAPRRFLYVVFPDEEQMDPADPETMQRHLKACADEHRITTIDLLPAMREASRTQKLFLVPYDRHPNGAGYAVAVAAIGAELTRLGWLPGRS